MVLASLIFDGAQALLGAIPMLGYPLGLMVVIIAWLTFFVWLQAKGMSMNISLKGKVTTMVRNPMVINAAAALVGALDIFGTIPDRTLGIITIIIFEYTGAPWAAPKRAGT